MYEVVQTSSGLTHSFAWCSSAPSDLARKKSLETQFASVGAEMVDAERQIAQQQHLIRALEAGGYSTTEAEKTLALMLTLVATMRETQSAVQWLTRRSIH